MDEFLATIINSTVGKAAEKITEVLLSKPWARDLDEGKVILEQLNDPLGRENYLRKHVLPSLKMRTLHNADYDIFLDDIYYPLTVEVASNKDKVVIKDGVTLPFHGIVNIVGIAGQGKSTILRKLFSEEIKKSERMPFFIELRRVKNANIIAYLADILNSFGVGCSEDSLKILLQSQRVVLMLDGFDEVKHEERTMMMN
ncbi:TPA: NACHT domain-containing protein, partial [Escherichia coli]|nr:NACHT domain-containing protein [Escherichia coli]